jgi:hypothetical protein
VLLDDFIQVLREVVLGTADDTKVGCSLLGKANRDLKLSELFVVSCILHFLKDDAFLHLTDILFFNYTHEVLEGVVNLIRIKLVALAYTFA